MSIRIMSNIWQRSKQKGTVLLMQLAIADHANDDGIAYPGIKHLAAKCRIEKRRAMQIIEELTASGDISLLHMGGGRGNKTVYQVAPFYLPDTAQKGALQDTNGAIQNRKGAIGDGKGERHDAPSYSESLKNHQLKANHQETTTTAAAAGNRLDVAKFLLEIQDRKGKKIETGVVTTLSSKFAGRLPNVQLAVAKWRKKPDAGIGLLVRILQNGELPLTEAEERRQYVEGEFSEFVQH